MVGEPSAAGFIAAYNKLLRATGMKLSLAEEFAGVSPAQLAEQTARSENAAMRDSNRRASSGADLLSLAESVLAVA